MKVIRLFICLFLFINITACSKDNSTFDETTEAFRTIIVSDYTGNVDITRSEGDKLNAYAGLGLYNGDDVKVLELSDLTLDVDSDKHLYAEEKTHFWLEAAGSEGHTKTKIHLESGSILCRVIKALNQDEAFEINTKTSTMSVRGTVFEVALLTASDGTTYELINVFDGKVVTKIEGSNKEITVMSGQAALVRESEDGKTSFVMTDQIDPEFWQSPDTDIVLIKQESDLDRPFFNIPYEKMPSETIAQLVEMAKDGEELCDTIDTLETIQTYGHEYVETYRVEPTCTNDGVRNLHCNICGHEIDEVLSALGHNFVTIAGKEATCTENGLTDGSKCDRCGKWGTYQKNIPALGHDGDPCKRCGGANPTEETDEPSSPVSTGDAYDPNLSYTINSVSIDNTSKPGNLILSGSNFTMAVNSKANISDSEGGSHTESFVMNISISGSSLSTNPGSTTTSSDILTNISSDFESYIYSEFWNIYNDSVNNYINSKTTYSFNPNSVSVKSTENLPNSIILDSTVTPSIVADQGGSLTASPTFADIVCTISGSNYSYSFSDNKYSSISLDPYKSVLDAKVEEALVFDVLIKTDGTSGGSFIFNGDPNHTSETIKCKYGSTITVNGTELVIVSGTTSTSCIAISLEEYNSSWSCSTGDTVTGNMTITYSYN